MVWSLPNRSGYLTGTYRRIPFSWGSWIVAIILGVVEGLTEFIPVSSTGHLIVAGSLLGFTGLKASSFEVAIQLGAILSVIFFYRKRLLSMILNKKDSTLAISSTMEGWSGLCRIGLATMPGQKLHLFPWHGTHPPRLSKLWRVIWRWGIVSNPLFKIPAATSRIDTNSTPRRQTSLRNPSNIEK